MSGKYRQKHWILGAKALKMSGENQLEPKKQPRVDSTLAKGLLILEALAGHGSGRGVSELARELNLTKSNTFRLLQTLSHLGYVRHGKGRMYLATLKAWRIGGKVVENLNLRELAQPEIRALSAATKETIYLAVPEELSVVYIDKIDSLRPIRTWNRVGGAAPIHCVGTGKAILAANYDAMRDRLEGNLAKYTDLTITDLNAMDDDVQKTRLHGYAVDRGEFREGVLSFGGAICLPNGVAIGAIGISVPSVNLPTDRYHGFGGLVASAARSISAKLARS